MIFIILTQILKKSQKYDLRARQLVDFLTPEDSCDFCKDLKYQDSETFFCKIEEKNPQFRSNNCVKKL